MSAAKEGGGCIPVRVGLTTESGDQEVLITLDQQDRIAIKQALTPEDCMLIAALLRDIADTLDAHKRRLDH